MSFKDRGGIKEPLKSQWIKQKDRKQEQMLML